MKRIRWKVAVRLSYTKDAWCLKVKKLQFKISITKINLYFTRVFDPHHTADTVHFCENNQTVNVCLL